MAFLRASTPNKPMQNKAAEKQVPGKWDHLPPTSRLSQATTIAPISAASSKTEAISKGRT